MLALLDHGITPDAGTVLVTGATGGVGSMAVAMLAGLGFTVAASTGKAEAEPFLRGLGASKIVDRGELAEVSRPLEAGVAGAVDAVGGATLANVLAQLAPFGAVAASGNAVVPTADDGAAVHPAASRSTASTPRTQPIDDAGQCGVASPPI